MTFPLCVDRQSESEPGPQAGDSDLASFPPSLPRHQEQEGIIAIFALDLFLLHSFIYLCACFRRHVSHGALVELRITCGSYFSPSIM